MYMSVSFRELWYSILISNNACRVVLRGFRTSYPPKNVANGSQY